MRTEPLPRSYEPAAIERRWYERWESQGLFRARPNRDKKPYTIVIPPPNVTGALHMGHALNNTLQDVLIRRARMAGYEALWLPGTDHAGIATQNVVERELAKEGLTRHDIGRERFVERVWQWREQYGGRIIEQLRRLGSSCDWERGRFTMDEGLSRAVRTVFVRWFDDGLIYRGLRIINWCPVHNTALSDIEVEREDVAGELVTFRYRLSDGSGDLPVGTTRVETMLGDTAIAVHPSDERYEGLVGETVDHPFFPGRRLPIVADDAVDPDFGTGAVKVTPAHDPTDFEIGERHGLEKINIFDENAHTNENGGRFAGLDRYEARRQVLEELEQFGLVDAVERPYIHAVGHCYRCRSEIEPWLSEQWFLRMDSLAPPAIGAVEDGRVDLRPRRFVKSYMDWMQNLKDWCISRQLWWGHRIPVWYCDDCGNVFAALEDPTSCPECGSGALHQDPDVLDTWFSSQLWPFSTLGWPDATDDLAYFYPTTTLVTGYDILYFWVTRMIMSGLYCTGDVPFRHVLLTGLVRDFEGKKMSKSAGNVIDPLGMIDRYGADALRFSLLFSTLPGNDTNISEDRIEAARNFANKLWNAARFVLMSLRDERPAVRDLNALRLEDRWILSRLDDTTREVQDGFEAGAFADVARALYRFIWSEFCDWYIELSKLRLSRDGEVAGAVLVHVLDHTLRLLHPIMPFLTEELWSRLNADAGSIMVAPWPRAGGRRDPAAVAALERMQDLVTSLRRLKVDHGIPPTTRIPVTVAPGEHGDEITALREAIVALARLESLQMTDRLPERRGEARTLTNAGIETSVALGDVIDARTERERLAGKLEDAVNAIDRSERKLANRDFTSKAPSHVVDKERAKLVDARAARRKLEAQLQALAE